jgi:Rieske Fe-S protein
MAIERRDFIRQACGLCASIVGISAILPALSSCTPLKSFSGEIIQGSIQLPLNQFAEDNNLVIVRNASLEFEIAVVKYANEQFRAFELQCTHRTYPLIATNSGFVCNQHGSRYDLDGKVTQAPAEKNLKEYTIQSNGEILNIKI